MQNQKKNIPADASKVSVYMDAAEYEASIQKMEGESAYRPWKEHGPLSGHADELGICLTEHNVNNQDDCQNPNLTQDAAIACEVKSMLAGRTHLAVKNLRIAVENGEVTLCGSVHNYDTLQQINALTERVPDVKSVVNKLIVEDASPIERELPEVRAPNIMSSRPDL